MDVARGKKRNRLIPDPVLSIYVNTIVHMRKLHRVITHAYEKSLKNMSFRTRPDKII